MTTNAPAKKTKSASSVAADVLSEKPKSSKDVAKAEKRLKKAVSDDLNEDSNEESEEDIFTTEDDPEAVEVEDEQTEALLKGFESDDEEEVFKDADRELAATQIPELDKQMKKKLKKMQRKQADKEQSESPGVIYLGRIPHGFYENEMRQYFTQFGTIKNIRLSRNPKTGASKHYAFIEFGSYEVADIVAKTMNNYLMFGHLLKCRVVPKEQVHADLFVGANKRFKKVPWNKIEGRKLAMPKGESHWDEKVSREQAKREKKMEALKKSGLIYDFDLPTIKSTKDVPKADRSTLVLEANPNDEEEKEVEDEAVKAIEPPKTSAKKSKAKKVVEAAVAEETVDQEVAEMPNKEKKTKKPKSKTAKSAA